MLTATSLLTLAGATAITLALVRVAKALWPQGPQVWITLLSAQFTVFVGAVVAQEAWTVRSGLLLFVSGLVITASALGSQSGVQLLIGKTSPAGKTGP